MPEADKKELRTTVGSWGLLRWESALLYQLLPLPADFKKEDIAIYESSLKLLRGEDPAIVALTPKELAAIDLTPEVMSDVIWRDRILRTVYVAINIGNSAGARILIKKMDEKANFGLYFPEAKEPATAALYRRIYVILGLYFFSALDEATRYFLFSNDLVLLAIKLGFNVEFALKDYARSMPLFQDRKKFCVDLAGLLADNEFPLNNLRIAESGTPAGWIKKFQTYAGKNADAAAINKFLLEDKSVGAVAAEEARIIKAILNLYYHLIDGSIILGEAELAKIRAQVRAPAGSKRAEEVPLLPDWKYLFFAKSIVPEQLAELKKWFGAVPADLAADCMIIYIKDVDWRAEPCFSNLARINDLYLSFYGDSAKPLFYYNEKEQALVLNEAFKLLM